VKENGGPFSKTGEDITLIIDDNNDPNNPNNT
jgi:hypothetical protein